jgi:site-specific DNA-methyltransferase (adenine-specific)
MTPYYEQSGVTIYHGDCREVVSYVPRDAALISDPPYGMNADTDSTRFTGGEAPSNRIDGDGREWERIVGDDEPFDPAPWLSYPRVILWGSNHYAQRLPRGTTLVWIKKHDHLFGTFLSDGEIAWMKGGHGVYAFRRSFPPPSRIAEGVDGRTAAHPTQKPIALMEWCIDKAGVPIGGLIFDPFMGSGTTLVAARLAGRHAIGCDVIERYCEIAAKRLQQEALPLEVA